jgi:hypothetical protein
MTFDHVRKVKKSKGGLDCRLRSVADCIPATWAGQVVNHRLEKQLPWQKKDGSFHATTFFEFSVPQKRKK